jgi:putative Mg2+ transporter-C (MgtC) family protein
MRRSGAFPRSPERGNASDVDLVAAVDMTTYSVDGDAFVRLLAAGLLGAVIGVEREAGDQPAGMRTHIAVALGAALFGIVSTLGFLPFEGVRAGTNVNIDVARVASNVAVGVGFLGAGVIFRSGNSIRNLTTAASLWTVAAIGLASGVGLVGVAGLATAVLLVSLVLLRPLRDVIRSRHARASTALRIRLDPAADPGDFLDAVRSVRGIEPAEVFYEKEDGNLVVGLTLNAHPDDVRAWMTEVSLRPEVDALLQA